MSASLADQNLAIALGANLGEPAVTLIAVRPLLEQALANWSASLGLKDPGPLACHWSPLFRTQPVGGPENQPSYLNAVVLIKAPPWACETPTPPGPQPPGQPPTQAALMLLASLQALEATFGRQRRDPWGPRSLDLDLLWCGELHCNSRELQLPHPRLLERSFVLAPLAAIDPRLIPPGQAGQAGQPGAANGIQRQSCGALLDQLLPKLREAPPERLPPQQGWPE